MMNRFHSLTALLAFGATAFAQNDDCAGAIAIGTGTTTGFTNVGATLSTPPGQCGVMSADLWFSHTATCTGVLSVSTCGNAGFDTVMEVFDGTCGALNLLGCSDDSCNLQSTVVVAATTGTTYLIRVGGYNGAAGTFGLTVTCSTGTGGGDDNCSGATPINLGTNGPFTNLGYTTSPPSWPCASGANDRWFSFTPTFTGTHTVTLCTTALTYDSALEIFSGSCAALVSLACNDDDCGVGSSLQLNLNAGTNYFVRVGGFSGSVGNFEVEVALGNGTGSIQLATRSGCGAATMSFTGQPTLGTTFSANLGNTTGTPLIGLGFNNPDQLFCGCSFGTDWTIVQFGTNASFTVPASPTFLNVSFFAQGADFGATGGCGFVLYTLTDAYRVTIG